MKKLRLTRFSHSVMPGLHKPYLTLNAILQNFLALTQHSFSLVGLLVAFVVLALVARPDLRNIGEAKLASWLQDRHSERAEPSFDVVPPKTPSFIKDLPTPQVAIAFWLSKKYGVALDPLKVLVAQAFEIGQKNQLDPTLILAVMAVESGFNPFAQSPVGAQGLMQVMTTVHYDKYTDFGGKLAAFDPVSNLRVGVKVLQECIARAGSIEGGLKYYVGAGNREDDGGYAAKVLAEHARLQLVGEGKRAVPTTLLNTALSSSSPGADILGGPPPERSLQTPTLPNKAIETEDTPAESSEKEAALAEQVVTA